MEIKIEVPEKEFRKLNKIYRILEKDLEQELEDVIAEFINQTLNSILSYL